MADTVRTLAALQALLADNSSGDISAQDVRDFLVSVFPPQFSGASVARTTSDQTISQNTVTAIEWNSENFDTDDYHDNSTNPSRLTVSDAGYYLVTTSFQITNVGGTNHQYGFQVNGGGLEDFTRDDGQNSAVNGARVLSLAADAYVEVAVYGTNDSFDIRSDQYSEFSITRLGQLPA